MFHSKKFQYEACFAALMSDPRVVDDLRKVINSKDSCKNSPLHYATQLWPQEVVRCRIEIMSLGSKFYFVVIKLRG